mmetsp:Transcript_14880/g.40102  ORF Transcript_14880/g.40102 Transcript_14880/m.40102 type:complete len:87 (-) Transcript_14880:504-764(-)
MQVPSMEAVMLPCKARVMQRKQHCGVCCPKWRRTSTQPSETKQASSLFVKEKKKERKVYAGHGPRFCEETSAKLLIACNPGGDEYS